MRKKVLIAMSGGVDSSVAVYLMKQRGFDCIGATMKLFNNKDVGESIEKSCCSLDDVDDARNVAFKLGVQHYIFNFTLDFNKHIIGKFIESYKSGTTPNPCIDCNRYMKFEKFLLRAMQLDTDYMVTGHYARIEYNEKSNRYLLKKAIDNSKDQSYVLYAMTQEQLKRTIFPLGELHKSKVREIAERENFVNAKKHDSQDICFVRNGDYAAFIEQYTEQAYESGSFIDMNGNILGGHNGTIRYTVGQRHGLGLSLSTPMYVRSIDTRNNTVTLCENHELLSTTLVAKDFNWIAYEGISAPVRIKAKIRYKHQEEWSTAMQIADGMVKIEFDEPQRAIALGQAVVLYDDDVVVGGGTISETSLS